jgi:hypothetical protein
VYDRLSEGWGGDLQGEPTGVLTVPRCLLPSPPVDLLPVCRLPVQDLVLSEVETLAVLGAGGFGKVTLVRYRGEGAASLLQGKN